MRAERLLCLAVAAVVVGTAGSAPGQGRARRDAEFTRGTLGDRPYRLFVPREVGARPPLIIALHGCWQTPEDFALGTRLNAAAQRRGLLVLYPAQRPRDNPSRCWNWFEPAHQSRTSGELAEILALVREVRSRYPGDRERTIALGFSAGAFMAVNLACVAPDVVAGVGVFAGGPYRCGVGAEAALQCLRGRRPDGGAAAAGCRPAGERSPPVVRASIWHGENDPMVHPTNFTALVTMFAHLAGMASGGSERSEGALRSLYRDGRGQPMLETWLVEGLGHAWSGGDPRGSHAAPFGPAATDHILDFLLSSERGSAR